MLNYTPHKPIYPAMVSAPDDTRIYRHRGESTAAWDNYGELVNYFQVMMKLFPKFEIEGYQTGKEATMTEEGIGTYAEVEPNQRGVAYKCRVDGALGDRYGEWHRIGRTTGDYWGYDPHGQVAENLNWDPSAGSWEGFSDGLFSGGSISLDDVSNTQGFKEKVKLVFVSYGSREIENMKNRPRSGPFGGDPKEDIDLISKEGINAHFYVSPNTAHEWQSWRRSLHEFAQLIFKD